MDDQIKDFRKFYQSYGQRKSMTEFDDFTTKMYQNPYILEEREMNVTQLDVFSRLMAERMIFFIGEVEAVSCSIISAQLMYLNSIDEDTDITININSPGGVVYDGNSLIDTIGAINAPVKTVNIGLAASMGLVILSAGRKGKRIGLPHAKYLLHQPLGGADGPLADIEISYQQLKLAKEELYEFMAQRTGQTKEKLIELSPRDYWFGSEKALEYGFIDEIQQIDWSKK